MDDQRNPYHNSRRGFGMEHTLSRRSFLWTAAAVTASGKLLYAQETPVAANPPPVTPVPLSGKSARRSVVALASGSSRRENICESLVAIEDQILPVLKSKKYVVIKPNIVNTMNQLASTNVDALHGIMDFLAPRFKGPVVIAESSAGFTTEGYDHFCYKRVVGEHKPLQVSLVDLNEEGKYRTHTILDGDLHAVPVRLAARLLDPGLHYLFGRIEDAQHGRGYPFREEHGSRHAAAQLPQGNSPLERQTPLPWRCAPDSR